MGGGLRVLGLGSYVGYDIEGYIGTMEKKMETTT